MTRFRDDPLLSLVRTYLRVASSALLATAAVAGIIGLISLLIFLVRGGGATPHDDLASAIFTLSRFPFLLILGWFLRLLWRIVDSVAAGTPFIDANADRLNRMAWLWLLVTGLGVASQRLLHWPMASGISGLVRSPAHGLLLAMTLFILARVFRQGAAMREDLEGTV